MAKLSGHAVIFRSSPTVFGDGWMPGSTSTLSAKPPRATWSAAMLLGLYRTRAPSYQLMPENSLQHPQPVREHSAKRVPRHSTRGAPKLYDIAQPDYARPAWPTRSCQKKRAASALHSLLCGCLVVLINSSRGHASGTNDARTLGDLGDIASPSRSAGQHNRSSLCSDARGMQVGRYQPQNPGLQHRLLAPKRLSPRPLCTGTEWLAERSMG
jgi:hypothetical protein